MVDAVDSVGEEEEVVVASVVGVEVVVEDSEGVEVEEDSEVVEAEEDIEGVVEEEADSEGVEEVLEVCRFKSLFIHHNQFSQDFTQYNTFERGSGNCRNTNKTGQD